MTLREQRCQLSPHGIIQNQNKLERTRLLITCTITMPDYCCVPLCNGYGGHQFPRDEHRKKLWMIAVRRNQWTPSRRSVVCKDHFTQEDYATEAMYSLHRPWWSWSRNRTEERASILVCFGSVLFHMATTGNSASVGSYTFVMFISKCHLWIYIFIFMKSCFLSIGVPRSHQVPLTFSLVTGYILWRNMHSSKNY